MFYSFSKVWETLKQLQETHCNIKYPSSISELCTRQSIHITTWLLFLLFILLSCLYFSSLCVFQLEWQLLSSVDSTVRVAKRSSWKMNPTLTSSTSDVATLIITIALWVVPRQRCADESDVALGVVGNVSPINLNRISWWYFSFTFCCQVNLTHVEILLFVLSRTKQKEWCALN